MRSYSESIKILHPIYDSLICFKSVKSQEIDYNNIRFLFLTGCKETKIFRPLIYYNNICA